MRIHKPSARYASAVIAALFAASAIGFVRAAFAEPLPTQQLTDTLRSLRGAHVLIEIINRKPVLRIYRSAVGEPGQCFIFYATKTLGTLNKIGYDLDNDFAITQQQPGATENDCMTRPIAP